MNILAWSTDASITVPVFINSGYHKVYQVIQNLGGAKNQSMGLMISSWWILGTDGSFSMGRWIPKWNQKAGRSGRISFPTRWFTSLITSWSIWNPAKQRRMRRSIFKAKETRKSPNPTEFIQSAMRQRPTDIPCPSWILKRTSLSSLAQPNRRFFRKSRERDVRLVFFVLPFKPERKLGFIIWITTFIY